MVVRLGRGQARHRAQRRAPRGALREPAAAALPLERGAPHGEVRAAHAAARGPLRRGVLVLFWVQVVEPAQDLVARKVLRDGGAAAHNYMDEVRALCNMLSAGDTAAALRPQLTAGCDALAETADWLLAEANTNMASVLAGATPYLRQFATVAGGAMMARTTLAAQAALDEGTGDPDFYAAKLASARFYAENILPQAMALITPIRDGHRAVLEYNEAAF